MTTAYGSETTGSVPQTATQQAVALRYLAALGRRSEGSSGGEPSWVANIDNGTYTFANLDQALIDWRTAHPEQDFRTQHPAWVQWASAQLSGNAGGLSTGALLAIGVGGLVLLNMLDNRR